MEKERLIGIDFGTSTSVIRVKNYDEKGVPIGDELHRESITFNNGASMVPTVIRRVGDAYTFGYDAETPARNSETFRSFKIDLQSNDPEEVEKSKQLVKKFFEYLFNEYNHQLITGHLGDSDYKNKTIVSYPVKWDSKIRDFMIETAKSAGFENVSGMDEAEAAIRAVTVQSKDMIKKTDLLQAGKPSNLMLIDMGAGTTDIVICKYTPGAQMSNEIITTWPKGGDILFGGQEMDVILKDFIISKFPPENQGMVKNRISVDKIKAWKENNVSPAMERNESVSEFSEADTVAYYLDINLEEFELNREKFEELFNDYIWNFVTLVGGAIRDSGLSPEDIDLVVLTGGHSRWYFIKELLLGQNEKFEDFCLEKIKSDPNRILSVALPQETVALGLVYSKLAGKLSFNKADHLRKVYTATKSTSALEEAASMGDAEAQCRLGYLYASGEEGYEKNIDKAVHLYMSAADKGNMRALYNLGCFYYGKREYGEAFEAFEKAGMNGVPEALNNLAVCYEHGLGIPENKKRALELLKQAYEAGYSEAKKQYERLFKELHPEQNADDLDKFEGTDPVEYAKFIWGDKRDACLYVGITENGLRKYLNRLNSTDVKNYYSKKQKIICFYDTTLFLSLKCGILITDKYIFELDSFLLNVTAQFIKIKDIIGIDLKDDHIIFSSKNGRKINFFVVGNDVERAHIHMFLNKLIEFLKNQNK